MKLTKKTAKQINTELHETLIECGAEIITDPATLGGKYYTLATLYGPLWLHPSNEAGSEVVTVFARFEDVEKARKYTRCNPHTGKWNFHQWVSNAEWFAGDVQAALESVRPEQ